MLLLLLLLLLPGVSGCDSFNYLARRGFSLRGGPEPPVSHGLRCRPARESPVTPTRAHGIPRQA